MASQQGRTSNPAGLMGQHPGTRMHPRGTVHLVQHETMRGTSGVGPDMDLERLFDIPFTTLDGHSLRGGDIVQARTLVMLIDAYRTKPERSAAEIAWVRERLEPGVDLVLIWPRGAVDQALAIQPGDGVRMCIDVDGEFRRLVSPSGKRLSVLADPTLGLMEPVGAESSVFSVDHGTMDGENRRNDHMIDLGDLRH
jgi:hypothetical protein